MRDKNKIDRLRVFVVEKGHIPRAINYVTAADLNKVAKSGRLAPDYAMPLRNRQCNVHWFRAYGQAELARSMYTDYYGQWGRP